MSPLAFYLASGGILAGLTVLELRAEGFRRGLWADRARARRNWSFLASIVLTLAILGLVTHEFPRFVPRLMRMDALGPIEFVGCFLVAELVNYVLHFVKHWNSYLWRFHFQHHIERNYDIWLTTHLHGLEVFVSACLMSVVLTLMGFSLLARQVYFLFYVFVTTYHHSANDYTLGWLDRLIVSPAYHRLHHAMDIRGNYAGTLTIYDALFGTAVWPERMENKELRFGIGSKREPFGFWKEILYMFRLPQAKRGS